MRLRKYILSLLFLIILYTGKTQVFQSYQKLAEFGASTGVSHYFGSLDPNAAVDHPKTCTSVFFTKQFNNYLGIKFAGTYAFLAYADKYSNNYYQQRRNLSFNTDIWEFTVMGDFNFYEFYPGLRGDYTFTPYVGLGIGAFSYNPYAYLNGQKYYLRDLGTEGQLTTPNAKSYSKTAICFPLSLGIKVNLTRRTNFYAELCYRFTTTGYIDDVNGIYSPNSFNPNAGGNNLVAYELQDRSYETGSRIGIQGRQRGNSRNDSYATLQVGISFNFLSYRCPKY